MQLPKSFKTNGEKMNDFSIVPAGDYVASIIKSEMVQTKKAKDANDPSLGQMLKMQARILHGEHKGSMLFIQLNLVNPNAQTVEIAEKELNTIGAACGLAVVEDSNQLHGIPMVIKVGISVDSKGKYPDQNTCQYYESAEGFTMPEGESADDTSAPAPSSPGKEAGKKRKPWES